HERFWGCFGQKASRSTAPYNIENPSVRETALCLLQNRTVVRRTTPPHAHNRPGDNPPIQSTSTTPQPRKAQNISTSCHLGAVQNAGLSGSPQLAPSAEMSGQGS